MKILITTLALLLCLQFTQTAEAVPLTGTLNIPGDYPTLAAAITDLNTQGVGSGGVTLNVISGNPQSAPLGGYVVGGVGSLVLTTTNFADQVTLQGNGNSVTAFTSQTAGLLTDAIFKLIGADYITITGFTMLEDPANSTTTAASNNMTEWAVALLHVSISDGCQNNTIQNNTISLKRIYQNSFGVYSNNRHSATSVTVANDVTNSTTGPNNFNKVYGNSISDVNYGTVFIGSGTVTANNAMDNGNDVGGSSVFTGNTYTNWGGIGVAPSGYLSLTGLNYCIFMNNEYNDNVSYNSITSASGTAALITMGGIFKNYSGGSTVQPTGTIYATYNNNTVTITNAPSAGTSAIIGMTSQGLSPSLITASITMNNNIITNCAVTGAAASAASFSGITNTSICGVLNINNNIIRGLNTTATSGNLFGIQNSANIRSIINLKDNKIGDATADAYTMSRASSAGVYGIYNNGGFNTALLTMTGNDIRGINHLLPGSGLHSYFQNGTHTGSVNISNNTFSNLNVNTTGTIQMIIDAALNHFAGSTRIINNNSVVTGFVKSLGGGSVIFYAAPLGNANTTVTEINSGNNFSNMTFTGTTAITGWLSTDGNPLGGSRKTVTNNTFSNITGFGGGATILTVSNSDNLYNGNNVSGNVIRNISGAGTVIGIRSTSQNQNFFDNVIDSLTGVSTIGINLTDGDEQNIYRNKLNAIIGQVSYGIKIENSGAAYNVYNNLIGNIIASGTPFGDCYGIDISAGNPVNVFYNTIYMPAISSGSLTSTGIKATNLSSAGVFTLKNNLVVVGSTGSGLATAYFNNDLTTYAAASNTNLFYAGTPGPNNLIYSNGLGTDLQTLSSYKTLVSPRDAQSITEDPNFISLDGSSPNYLHIDSTIATLIESGAGIIAGIDDDYDLQPRFPNIGYPDNIYYPATNPDIGADEFGGFRQDTTGPAISYSTLIDTCEFGNRNLNSVTITDGIGVAGGANKPRVYWKVNTIGSWASAATSSASSPYNFVIGTAGLINGDSVFYFVIAQDGSGNVTANPGAGLVAADVNTVSVFPSNPNYYVANCTDNVGVVSVSLNPDKIYSLGKGYDFTATVKNLGTSQQNVVPVYYKIGINGTPLGPVNTIGPIDPDSTETVLFNGGLAYVTSAVQTDTLLIYTSLPGDISSPDDTLTIILENVFNKITSFPYLNNCNSLSGYSVLTEATAGTNALWGKSTGVNPNGNANDTAYASDFYNGSAGRREVLRTPEMNLSSLVNPVLNFYIAYKTNTGGQQDTMQVMLSTDGGLNFFSATTVYDKSESSVPSLSTRTGSATAFTPDSAIQYRHETISLANVAGQSNVVLGFRAKSENGNFAWIDDIIVTDVDNYCTSNVTGTGVFSCNPLVSVNFTALLLPPAGHQPDNNPSGGIMSVSGFFNSDPGQMINPNTDLKTPNDGIPYDPTFVYHDIWFTVTYTGNDQSGYATYNISIDYDTLYFAQPDQLYIVKRSDKLGKWNCCNTTRTGTVLTASGLTDFCDIGLAGNDALPVELASFVSSVSGNIVRLEWTTLSETNNSGFDIERSKVIGQTSDGWNKVGFVKGNGNVSVNSNYQFTDRDIPDGTYSYRLKQIDFNGNFEYFNLRNEVKIGVPGKFSLSQNYPNPFNPTTKINYNLPADAQVKLKVFDITGREVVTLVNEFKTAGYYTADFNASNLSSGTYFYKIESGAFTDVKRMMIVK